MITNGSRILIVSPHADDESIGLGGFMAKVIRKYDCQILVVVLAVSDVYSVSLDRIITKQERLEEMRHCLEYIGDGPGKIKTEVFDYEDGILDTIPIRDLIKKLDGQVKDFRPDVMLYPYPSHHQDHQVAYQASVASARPNKYTTSIRIVGMYEYTYYDVWNPYHLNKFSKIYCDISGYIDIKMKGLEKYVSQMQRDSQDLLQPEAIRMLSVLRGREVGVDNAEVLYLMRGLWI